MSDQNIKKLNAKDKNRLKQGRGKGTGKNYVPFIKVGDFSSSGESIRVGGNKTHRIHHLHSGIEFAAFLLLNWSRNVIDVREQFPIPLNDSLQICTDLGIKHPQVKGELAIVTSDFVVNEKGNCQYVVAVKPAKELSKKRTIDKLQIEKAYWEMKGFGWFIFTDKDISNALKTNMKWLKSFINHDNNNTNSISEKDCQSFIYRINKKKDNLITKYCGQLDDEYGVVAGFHLEIFRFLIANGIISLPLNKIFHDWTTSDININSSALDVRINYHAS